MAALEADEATRQRVFSSRRALLEWEQNEVRNSLREHLQSAGLHLFSLESINICTAMSQELLRESTRTIFSSFFENLFRGAIGTLELQRRRVITSSAAVEHWLLSEAEHRPFLQHGLERDHCVLVLCTHHMFLCAQFRERLSMLCAARDVKLAEEMCRTLESEEFVQRSCVERSAHLTLGSMHIQCGEAVRRAGISREQRSVRETRWRCPSCQEFPPARSSMLAEHPMHPIRGEDMLQLHLLHHAADVTRRMTVRNATVREETQTRARLAHTALVGALMMTYDYRRRIVQVVEENTRAKRFLDPAVWRASIRAAIEATAMRQLSEQDAVRLRADLGRLQLEEECRRLNIRVACDLSVLHCPFFLTRRRATAAPGESAFSATAAAVPGIGIICRKNITTARRLFEIRLQFERPLDEDTRELEKESHLMLPTLPSEASHVRRKMGADEIVADADRFMFGGAAGAIPGRNRYDNNISNSAGAISDSLDALFAQFNRKKLIRRGSASPLSSQRRARFADFQGADGTGDDFNYYDGDATRDDNDQDLYSLGMHSSDDDGVVSEGSNDMFELQLELDELQRKESGSRLLVADLEWHRRVALERRLQVMPVRKLSIPQHERDMMALLKLEPFHRNRLTREAWRETDRLAGVISASLREARKQLLRNAPSPPKPAFHVGRLPQSRVEIMHQQRYQEELEHKRALLLQSVGGRTWTPPPAKQPLLQQQSSALPPRRRSPSPPKKIAAPPTLGGFPADRLVLSLNRSENQLLMLFQSVLERRHALRQQLSEIELQRNDAAASALDEPPTWTTSSPSSFFSFSTGPSSAAATCGAVPTRSAAAMFSNSFFPSSSSNAAAAAAFHRGRYATTPPPFGASLNSNSSNADSNTFMKSPYAATKASGDVKKLRAAGGRVPVPPSSPTPHSSTMMTRGGIGGGSHQVWG